MLSACINSKNQINPAMQSLSHHLTFKNFIHLENEFIFIVSPFRQFNVVNYILILSSTKIIRISVFKKFRKVIKLRNQLLNIIQARSQRFITIRYTEEETVSKVKFIALQFKMLRRKWINSDKVITNYSSVWIKTAIKKLGQFFLKFMLFSIFISLF